MRRKPDTDDPRIGAPSPADAPTTPRAPAVRRRATSPSGRSSSDSSRRRSGPAAAPTEPTARTSGPLAGGPAARDSDGADGGTGTAPGRITPGRTRVGGAWVGFILGAVVLIFLLVFVVQNLVPVEVTFLGLRGTLPLGVWLLFAAVAGVLLLAIPGLARLLQWRRATGAAGGRPRR